MGSASLVTKEIPVMAAEIYRVRPNGQHFWGSDGLISADFM
jgi:hypothetical protein